MERFLPKLDKFAKILKLMKNTALTTTHINLNAKMVPFAGYNMPVSYEGVNAEHETVRKGVGVFDVSHMGEFLITGEKALELIQKISSNDASTLVDGKAQYSCMPNNEGGIVDDLIIYRFNAEKYLLVVNASNIEKDWNWISQHNTMDATMRDLSDEYSLLAIQGPKAAEAMQSLTSVDLKISSSIPSRSLILLVLKMSSFLPPVIQVAEDSRYILKMRMPRRSGTVYLKPVRIMGSSL